VSGSFEVGQALSASSGQWDGGGDPPSYSYAWQRCRIGSIGSPGTGPGELESTEGIAIGASGDMWVSQPIQGRLTEFNEAHEFVRSVGGSGPAPGELGAPLGVAVDVSGDVWVADWEYDRIVEFDEEGEFIREFGSEGSGEGELLMPRSFAVDSSGHVWVADTGNARVEEFNESGEYLAQVGSSGSGAGQFEWPTGIATNSSGDVWVVDNARGKVEGFDAEGAFLSEFGTSGEGPEDLSSPSAITIDSSGHLWITDTGHHRVDEFDEHGSLLNQIGPGLPAYDRPEYPGPLALDAEGNVWLGDFRAGGRVAEFDQEGHYIAKEPCVSIEGATSSSYTLTGTDLGFEPRVTATATNGSGEATAVGFPNTWLREGSSEPPEWPTDVFPPTTRPGGRSSLVVAHYPRAARESLADQVAGVAADERASDLVSRCYIRCVIHRDPVLLGNLGGATEQGGRRRDDPAVGRDPVDRFEQRCDVLGLAPGTHCHIRDLVPRKVECRERDVGIGKKFLGRFVKLVVGIERRQDDARVQ